MKSFGKIIAALTVFMGIIFFLNWSFPFSSDDCFYGSICLDDVWQRLGSIGNALVMTLKDPHRPFVHFVVRVFSGCFDKWVFNVCNTAMMGLLIVLVNRLAFKSWKLNIHSVVLTIAMTFFVLCKGESYLWCAGSVNYLWVAVWTMGFCLILERLEKGPCPGWSMLLFVPAAIICGGSNETFTPPMCVAMLVLFVVKDRKPTVGKVLVFLGYVIPMVAMAIYERQVRVGAMMPAFSIQNFLVTLLQIAVTIKCVWLMLIVLALNSDKKAFLVRNLFELTMVAVSVAMVVVVGFHGERTLWCANLFAMIIVVREWQPEPWFLATAAVAVLGVALCLVPYGLRIRANFNAFIAQYLASADGVACHEFVPCGWFGRYFHQVMYQWRKPSTHPVHLAHFYGRTDQPIGLPRELYEGVYLSDAFCVETNRLALKSGLLAYTMPQMNTIVVPLAKNPQVDPKANHVSFRYAKMNEIWKRIQAESLKGRRPTLGDADSSQLFKTMHGDYLLIAKELVPDNCLQDIALGGK